ncbi:hypothetical protein ALC60_08241 [Trachymyrmex zeteki]|uniref:Uncharacterized protein n=1 Tax=Mycetomoellerius zeteki TaxID=64791 RepID=A0A151WXM0_9HYME|nr:hypothetical protein ALC60_08241 [Trachymyrmex zeteki]
MYCIRRRWNIARRISHKRICVSCRICALSVVTIDENTSFSSEPHCESINGSPQTHEAESEPETARSDAPSPPPCRSARGEGFAKKRAASLISSIRRPGNAPSKLPVEFTLEDTH